MTLQEAPINRTLRNSDLKLEIEKLKQTIRKPLPEEASKLGVSHYKMLVFGNIGAGKSSLLNTITTAESDEPDYQALFKVGQGDKESTTSRVWDNPIARRFVGMDIPGASQKNYLEIGKVHRLIEDRIPHDIFLDKSDWSNKILPLDPSKFVHIVVFVVSVDELGKPGTIEDYGKLKNHFIQYRENGLEGYTPFLVITKGDLCGRDIASDLRKLYDSDNLFIKRKIFCTKTNISTDRCFFIPNYCNGAEYEKNDIVDYLTLNFTCKAISDGREVISKLAKFHSTVKVVSPFSNLNSNIEVNIHYAGDLVGVIEVNGGATLDEVRKVIYTDELLVGPFLFLSPDKKKLTNEKVRISDIMTDTVLYLEVPSADVIDFSTKENLGEIQNYDINESLVVMRKLLDTEGISEGWKSYQFCTPTGAPLTVKQETSKLIRDVIKEDKLFVRRKL